MTDRWYAPLECTNTVANPLIVAKADLKGVDDWDLVSGHRVQQWTESAWFRAKNAEADGDPDDVLQNHLVGLPIYSHRLRAALAHAGVDGIQYLPVHIVLFNGTQMSGFAIANIVDLVPALDLARSDYKLYGPAWPKRQGEISALRVPVLRRAALRGHDIIRLREYPLYVCVSERFKEIFERGAFTGYSFRELQLA